MRNSTRSLIGLMALATLASACGNDRPPVTRLNAADQPTRAVPGDELEDPGESKDAGTDIGEEYKPNLPVEVDVVPEVVSEFVPSSFSNFVHHSDLAVMGTVVRVSEPFLFSWVQPAGKSYPDYKGRYATTRVDEVLYGSQKEGPSSRGDEITVLLWGDGTNTGGEVGGSAVKRENARSGPVTKGEQVLWVMHDQMPDVNIFDPAGVTILRTDPPPLMLIGHYEGNWKIEGNTAENVDPKRTLPVEKLKGLLLKERKAPHRFNDRQGTGDLTTLDESDIPEPAPTSSETTPSDDETDKPATAK